MLGVMGVPVRIRQLFLRHSDIRLTIGPYDDDMLYSQAPVMEAFNQVEHQIRCRESQEGNSGLVVDWYEI